MLRKFLDGGPPGMPDGSTPFFLEVGAVPTAANAPYPSGSIARFGSTYYWQSGGPDAAAVWVPFPIAGASGVTASQMFFSGRFGQLGFAWFANPGAAATAIVLVVRQSFPVSVARTVRNLRVQPITNTMLDMAFVVEKNGVATALTVNFGPSQLSLASDLTHSFTCVSGDKLSLAGTSTDQDSEATICASFDLASS